MAEMLTAASDVSAPEIAQPEVESAATARVRKFRRRFLAAWHHPLWTRFRKESQEDFRFASGTGQWPEALRSQLEGAARVVLTINEIRPVVEVLVGYERSARLDLKPVPEGPEDLDNVTVLGRLMKRTIADQDGEYLLSDGFKEGIIGGLAAWYIGTDYTQDPIHGRVTLELLKQGEVCWTPEARKYDLSDASEVFWHKMVPMDDLLAAYPDQADAIQDAVDSLRTANPVGPVEIPSLDPHDGYKKAADEVLDAVGVYDPELDEIRVLQVFYQDWETVHLLVDRRLNTVDEIPEEATALRLARELAQVDPELTVIARRKRQWKTSVILPATGQEIEHGVPFENDADACPIVPFIAYREGDDILGVVRNLKDPQREINKRRSAIADNVSKHGQIKWMAHRTAVENPEFFEGGQGAGNTLWLRPGQAAPKEISPPQMPEWIYRMDEKSKQEIREISGVNAPLQGIRSAAESGVALERLQMQGQIISTGLFDNYRRSRRIVGQRLARRIQEVFTSERTIRLDPESGPTEFVTLNQRSIDEFGRETVLRNIPDLKFDVQISESPTAPTARAASLMALLELIQRMPELRPALADVVIELTDLPNRAEVLQRVRQVLQITPPPPPQGPAAGGNRNLLPATQAASKIAAM